MNLNEADVCALFSSDQLSVISEEKVFEAAMEWVRFDVAVRNKSLRALLEHVRLPLLTKGDFNSSPELIISSEFLVSISQENELLKDADKDCKDLIIEALTYHLLPIELKTKRGRSEISSPFYLFSQEDRQEPARDYPLVSQKYLSSLADRRPKRSRKSKLMTTKTNAGSD